MASGSFRNVTPGSIPSSVIRWLVERTQKALKILAEYVLEQRRTSGRPAEVLRRLYDLPAQRMAFNSFEISFRSPLRSAELFTGTADDPLRQEIAALGQIGTLLGAGLVWATQGSSRATPSFEGRSTEERRVILEAVKQLAPSMGGEVQTVEVRGSWVPPVSRPVRLSPESRRLIASVSGGLQTREGRVVEFAGRIRELDLDRLQFHLREINGEELSRRFVFDEDLLPEVSDIFQEQSVVRVVGIEESSAASPEAVALMRERPLEGV